MKKPCRCLSAEIPEGQELARLVRERIGEIPEEEQAGEDIRQQRLAKCRQCSHLVNGTCGLCGCYVEIRAARGYQHCPAVPPEW